MSQQPNIATLKPTGPNADQIEYWNGRTGEQWTIHQDWLDKVLAPLNDAVMRRANVQAGETVLDVGCGCGATSLMLAEQAGPDGSVLGIDISAPMLARAQAQEKATAKATGSQLEFLLADAASHAFTPAHFDLVFSRFGVMFFADPEKAFTNIRRGLKKDARLTFICWRPIDENDWMITPVLAALAHLPAPEPGDPNAPGPFAFAAQDRIQSILQQAGFNHIEITPVDKTVSLGSGANAVADATEFSTNIGPASRLLAEADPGTKARAIDAIRDALAEKRTSRGIELAAACWLVHARN